ncbi:MAG: hypothetical protein IJ324_10975 [Lachnospiraceae bacterium]|nr:hypothetical protein [Lachnospiraceae bacterium]
MSTGTERIKALIAGKPLDQYINAATWMHVPAIDRDPDAFAEGIINYAEEYGSDIVKVQLNAAYLAEAYGEKIEFFENPPLKFQKVKKLYEVKEHVVKGINDLAKIDILDVHNNPVIQRDVKAVKKIIDHYQGAKPVLPTLFSSLTWLEVLTEGGLTAVKELIAKDKNAVHKALQNLNEVNKRIVDEYVAVGADGFFFATAFTSPHVVTESEFEEFSRQYDLDVLEHIHKKTWFNMLHIHGNADLYIEKLVEYPVEAINWENATFGVDKAHLTSAAKLRSLTDKILIGGTDQFHDYYGSLSEVEKTFDERLETLIREIPDRRFIFGAGCSLPLDIPSDSIKLIRKVADKHSL